MSLPTSPCRRSSRARISSSRSPPLDRLLAGGVVAALCGLLLYRIAPDVRGRPLYEDEAVAGLISMRPLGEVLETVMVDRGGAPLHFVLTHGVFSLDASADALRWLSVVCAVASVPLCFDLGRRLGGQGAGLVAAAVAASSTALAVYGSFGRMYALYVLVAALAADLFVRALELRTPGAVAAAAAAFWLLPAVHPYGLIPALVALAVAALLWRRRSLRSRSWPRSPSCSRTSGWLSGRRWGRAAPRWPRPPTPGASSWQPCRRSRAARDWRSCSSACWGSRGSPFLPHGALRSRSSPLSFSCRLCSSLSSLRALIRTCPPGISSTGCRSGRPRSASGWPRCAAGCRSACGSSSSQR